MKNISNEYTYDSSGVLKSVHGRREYKTKLKHSDIPEYYCDMYNYKLGKNILLNSKDVKDLEYTWVMENHFMKDSLLRISYSGEIVKKNDVESLFYSYENVDTLIFGTNILKFLAYVKKYSDYDISHIKDEFIKQCQWLYDNEREFAPMTEDFGAWFDEQMIKYLK